jgi:lipoate-protein ligase A
MLEIPCRWMLEGPAGGAWQMAVDEVLLETAAELGQATLRFYQWSEPTLSLGYFQAYAERRNHIASRDCAVVRRQTGGGAIMHDREWTYSLALPVAHPLAADGTFLYHAVHEALCATLGTWDVPLSVRDQSSGLPANEQPFLCFLRKTEGDVLCEGTKVCGSAQRRRRGAILQHGSLILARSPHAPEVSGVWEVAGKKLFHEPIAERWAQSIAQRLHLNLVDGRLSELELDSARTLALEKYTAGTWTQKR